jgi:hypothetical protein
LRYVFEAHPEFACPPEINLSTAFTAINYTVGAAACDRTGDNSYEAVALCRELAARTIGAYADRAGKPRWCEKSLPSSEQAKLLLRVFPEAKFICLYRECTDSIASLVEACTWSYGAYGVEPYIRLYPSNMALALALYWADKVEAMRDFENDYPDRCFRVRYEDLVTSPEKTLRLLFSFVGVDWAPQVLEPSRLFTEKTAGPGDFKIAFTQSIRTDSVGRGWNVPIEAIPPDVRTRINELLSELNYPLLEADIKDSLITTSGAGGLSANIENERATPDGELNALFARMALRLEENRRAALPMSGAPATVKIVLADETDPYVLDFSSGRIDRSDRPTTVTMLTDSQTLLSIATGACNAGTALRQSTLRLAEEEPCPPEILSTYLHQIMAVVAA